MISSTANAQIKNIIQLQTKAKARNKQNCFVIEGIRMFMEVPQNRLVKTYVETEFFEHADETVKKQICSSEYELVEKEVFKRISDTMTPQGILAIVQKKECTMEELVLSVTKSSDNQTDFGAGRYLILEDIQDPGNLGTILRTAEGAGVTAVIMSAKTVDIYNPKVVRSTMGSIFRVPFVYADNLEQVVTQLKKDGVTVYAAHLSGEKHYFEMDYKKPTAFLIGNEGNGLSDAMTSQADERIRIPMLGKIESLNAASAATILMYEALRQNLE
ncbi:MAG: RNA methyltransferase [Lachnospiraceae bacterium]|nr:RNA methyltransferase [Lachnospiraceae bacterium]